jgi:hypothetical protein
VQLQASLIQAGALALLAFGCDAPQGETEAAERELVVAQPLVVEAACGECQFELEGDGCDLAVRIDGQGYFVQGTSIDEHGDAHADDGFCNAIREARVTGHVEGQAFVADSFELLPAGG